MLSDPFYKQGLNAFVKDLVVYILLLGPSFLGLVSATGCFKKLFNKVVELQRMKLFVAMAAVSVFTLIFTTQTAIKMMAIFILMGGVF